jgi:hypothetical protein
MMVLPAENVETLTIVPAKLHTHEDAQNVKLRSQPLPVQYFTIANFQSVRLSILRTMFAKAKKTYQLMNMPGDYH